jgi:hypothetical protein
MTSVSDDISRNIYFVFHEIIFLFREISNRTKMQNFEKIRDFFASKLNFWQGRMHFAFCIAFQYHQKDNFMSKICKYLFVHIGIHFFGNVSDDPNLSQNFPDPEHS